MKRETITISVKSDMKKYILKRGSTDFESVSDYIRSLVRKDNYYQRKFAKPSSLPVDGNTALPR